MAEGGFQELQEDEDSYEGAGEKGKGAGDRGVRLRRDRCYGVREPGDTRLAFTDGAPLSFQCGWGQDCRNTEALDRVCPCPQGVVPSDCHWRSGVLTEKQCSGLGIGEGKQGGTSEARKLSRSPVPPTMWLADIAAAVGSCPPPWVQIPCAPLSRLAIAASLG